MAITILINGTNTLDESPGLQTGGVAAGAEDNNDNDVSLATLLADPGASVFYNRLFTAGGLNLSSTFATANGVARSASNYISLTGTGDITSLGFTTSAGAALPVYSAGVTSATGAACNLTALSGGTIGLFSDSVLGNRVAYGVDTQGNIVFAMFMDPAAALTSAEVWMVQFEALANTNPANHDDPLTLSGLGVGAGVSTEFNFNELPSGSNLFGMLGSGASGLIVHTTTSALKNDGTYISNSTLEVKTSQAGPNATIGMGSQMFDPGDASYFTFVRNPNANFTSFNLSPGEADDADNMVYGDADAATNDTIEASSAFMEVAQIQSGGGLSMSITAYNIAGSPQGRDLISGSGANEVNITRVVVYAADGITVLDDSDDPAGDNPAISFDLSGNGAIVTGFGEYNRIEWYTSAPHDQVKIAGVSGKFDIGGFGVNEPTAVSAPLTGLRFEDDGPAVDLVLNGSAEVRVDESTLPAVDSILAADLFSTNTANFGTDGAGTSASVYKLLLGDPNSGLFDTATGNEVILSVNAAGTLLTGAVNGGANVVFTIAINASTGEVTLTQSRAMINGDITDPDESDTPLELEDGAVSVQRTITDGDGDSASDSVDISPIFKFEDAGPSLPPATQDVLELVTDDTDIEDDATLSTDLIFPGAPSFGSDGPHPITPVDFSLRLVTNNGDSGLVDTATGKAIRFNSVGADIVGYVDNNGDGVIGAGETLEAVRYSLTAVDADTETVTFTQSRAVFHAIADTTETVNSNLVFVDRVAIDGDGDPSEKVSFDLGEISFLLDDEPSIGPVDDGLVDFALNSSVTKTLNGAVGNDPNASPYILTNFTPSVLVNGVTVTGVLAGDNKSVTYWANTNGNAVIGDAGDTAYYKLELGDQGSAGDYTFTVLINPPPAFTEFNFDDLPSGANLFGIVGDADAGLVVFGKNIGLKGDNTFIANQTQEVKTSQAGPNATIGIESQMFDPGDAAYFTFVNDPDPNFTGLALGSGEADDADNILYGSALENDSAFLRIAQLQGSNAPSMSIELFNIAGSPQGVAMLNARGNNAAGEDPDVIAVRVYAADGTTLLESYSGGVEAGLSNTITISINGAGVATVTGFGEYNKIEWDADEDFDQTLITGVGGKFDIGGFGFLQGNDTPDQVLEFTARVTDGDADTDTASWSVGIDGTGTFDDGSAGGISSLAVTSALAASYSFEARRSLDDLVFVSQTIDFN